MSMAQRRQEERQNELDFFNFIVGNRFKAIERLLSKGFDVNALDQFGLSGLFVCVRENNLPMFEFLLAHGADLNLRSPVGSLEEFCNFLAFEEDLKSGWVSHLKVFKEKQEILSAMKEVKHFGEEIPGHEASMRGRLKL